MKELIKSISKKEWQFVAIMAVVLAIITGLPYLYAYFTAPAGTVYNGLNSLTPADNPVYYSYINQVKQGSVLVQDLFTTEDLPSGLFNIVWFVIGIFARIFNLSPILAFHLARLLLIPIFIAVAYLFISLFFSDVFKRKISLVFLLFSAGLGAYFIVPLSLFNFSSQAGYGSPNDIWIPESITFLSLYKTPHFIVSLILMFLIFLLMILAFEKKYFCYALWSGFLSLIYFNFHPFYIPMVFGALGLYLLFLFFQSKKILWQPAGYFLSFVVISSISIFYHLYCLAQSPMLAQRGLQNVTLAPSLVLIFVGYGLLWILAGLAIFYLIKTRQLTNRLAFLLIWLVFSIFLVWLPNQFQSRYTQGLHFPLVIFSVFGWFIFKDEFLNKRFKKYYTYFADKVFLVMIFVLFIAVTNIFNLTRDYYYFTFKPGVIKKYFYLPQDAVLAMAWLANENPPAEKRILASVLNSLFIPGYANQRVYVAHGIETLDYLAKQSYLVWFFGSDKQANLKLNFLHKNNIDYIFYGEEEKSLGNFNPADKNYLKLVFDLSQAKVYQVVK